MLVRVVNRVLCAVLALALLVAGLVVIIEIVLAGLQRGPWLVPHDRWWRWATTTAWSHRSARLLFAGLVLTGLVLLTLEVRRRHPSSLPLAPGPGGVASELDRRDVERWLAEWAGRVEGVTEAQAEVRNRVVRVRAGSVGGDTGAAQQRTRDTLARHLEELGLARPLAVKVDVRSKRVL